MFIEQLITAKENGTPISIYTDFNDTDRFSFGFVLGISDENVLLGHISPLGLYDGYIVKKCKDISRIEIDGKYSRRVYKLYQLRKQSHANIDVAGNLFLDLLNYALEHRLIVNIELSNSNYDDVQGYVSTIQGEFATFEQLDNDGVFDGYSTINLGDVTHIVCDSDVEMALKLLAENQ